MRHTGGPGPKQRSFREPMRAGGAAFGVSSTWGLQGPF